MRDQDSPSTPTLDRVWAATRPADLTGDEFDRIWAEVSRAHDHARPTLLPFTPPRRRALTIAVLGLAQVAAVAAVAFVLMRKNPAPGPVMPPALTHAAPPAKVHHLTVEAGELVEVRVRTDGRLIDLRRTQADPGADLALLDVPEVNPSDELGRWEVMAAR